MKKNILMVLGNDLLKPHVDNRVLKEAESLIKSGYCVSVLCRSPNNLPRNEVYNKINVYRLSKKNLLGWFVGAVFFIKRFLRKNKVDLLHCHDLGGFIVGSLFKLFVRRKTKVIYDAHELASEMFQPKIINKTASFLEHLFLPLASGLIVTNTDRLGVMKQKHSILKSFKPILELPNYPKKEVVSFSSKEFISSLRKKYLIPSSGKIFVYQGPLSFEKRGINTLVSAFMKLNSSDCLILIGGQNSNLENLIQSNPSKGKVIIIPWLSQKELYGVMSLSDFGVVAYKNICLNNYYCAPNKTYEYMASNLAIIGSDFPIFKREVSNNNIGFNGSFDSEKHLLRALKKASAVSKQELADMKSRSKQLFDKQYNWEILDPSFFRFYEEVLFND
ncbi:glycosyltransferase [Candidatus Woesearchaeota archaeon]|nr:glycosyltransferase [Candidatus Woesearchaeota archaeon]